MPAADDVHEWVSFEDPAELRTWVFDATYLRSRHRCIYGEGCQGVLDPKTPKPRITEGIDKHKGNLNVIKHIYRERSTQRRLLAMPALCVPW